MKNSSSWSHFRVVVVVNNNSVWSPKERGGKELGVLSKRVALSGSFWRIYSKFKSFCWCFILVQPLFVFSKLGCINCIYIYLYIEMCVFLNIMLIV